VFLSHIWLFSKLKYAIIKRAVVPIRQEDSGRNQIGTYSAAEAVKQIDAFRLLVGKNVTGEYLLRLAERRDKDCETQSLLNGIWPSRS
jgi:hypothetical protein